MLKFKHELDEGLLRFVNFLLRIFASSGVEDILHVYRFLLWVARLSKILCEMLMASALYLQWGLSIHSGSQKLGRDLSPTKLLYTRGWFLGFSGWFVNRYLKPLQVFASKSVHIHPAAHVLEIFPIISAVPRLWTEHLPIYLFLIRTWAGWSMVSSLNSALFPVSHIS